MELKEYIEHAKKTESQIKDVVVDPAFVVNVLYMFIASGNMLDQIKKHIFYGKKYNEGQLTVDYQMINNALDDLKFVRVNGTSEDMEERPVKNIDPRVFHALLGIATESAELCEILFNALTNQKELDGVDLGDEWGDECWYGAILMDALNLDWNKVLEANIMKLEKRYDKKFSSEKAINRDTTKERKALENGLKERE